LAYQSYDLYFPCGTTTPADQRVVYNGNQSPGEIILASNGLCYTIVGPTTVGGATNTVVSEHSTCEDCEAARPTTTTTSTSTTTTTSTSTTTLPPIGVSVVDTCASYPTACDGQFYIANIVGGTGTGYQTRLDGGAWNNWPAFNTYTSICGGSTYTIDAQDSVGTFASSGPVTLCSNTTTTTTTAAPTTTTTTIIYSGLTLCGEATEDYYYTGQISSGQYLFSGGGFCYVSSGTIVNLSGKSEIFGTINGCSC
jgi:hypothetical protein